MEFSNVEKELLRNLGKQNGETRKTSDSGNTDAGIGKKRKTGNGFSDIAGMENLKKMVIESFINVFNHIEIAKAYGIKPPSMLFYGPAGCGKTFFAEKMAEELGINFVKIVPDDIACTWVHGTQQKIGEVFRDAEKKAPTLLFFDEFDAMVPRRSGDEANQHYNSEVNEFLCMLNNASDRGVYVLAATNHPERIDKAVLRTGRIDELVYIDMPDKEARKNLFDLALSKLPTAEKVDTEHLAELTNGYNCSDITYMVEVAARKAFNEAIRSDDGCLQPITQSLLEEIIAGRTPSVSSKDMREYEQLRCEFSSKDKECARVRIGF